MKKINLKSFIGVMVILILSLAVKAEVFEEFHWLCNEFNHYRGYLHCHTGFSDGEAGTTPYDAFVYARDVAQLDFLAVTDHSEYLNDEDWRYLQNAADLCNDEGKFVAFYGFEWGNPFFGHTNVINSHERISVLSHQTLPLFYSWIITQPDAIGTYNHPGPDEPYEYEFLHFEYFPEADDFMVGMEVIHPDSRYPDRRSYDGTYCFFDTANRAGWHIGALQAQDNHSDNWGTRDDTRTVVLAHNLTRDDLLNAYRTRNFYASTDKNLILDFRALGQPMGSKLPPGKKLFFAFLSDPDNEKFSRIEVYKNGDLFASADLNQSSLFYDFEAPSNPEDSYYYLLVYQKDGDQAQSSPIWVKGGLVNDDQPPYAQIDYPQNGETINATEIVIRGRAYDQGSGLACVMVSLDGGNTWKRADGLDNWSCRLPIYQSKPYLLMARAWDHNSNYQQPADSVLIRANRSTADIKLGGYWSSRLNSQNDGLCQILAYAPEPAIKEIGLFYYGMDTGIRLAQQEKGIYQLEIEFPSGLISGQYLLEFQALGADFPIGSPFPYLIIH